MPLPLNHDEDLCHPAKGLRQREPRRTPPKYGPREQGSSYIRGCCQSVWTAADLSAALKPDSAEPLAYEYATTCPLLVIDDLGRERVTDWWLKQLQRIVDHRCAHELRLVITTNTAGSADGVYDELSARYGHPVVERLIDGGGLLVLDGPAHRRVVAE